MRDYSLRPGALNLGRLVRVFAAISFVLFVVLAAAPVRPYFAEWREVQDEYNRQAARAGLAAVPVGIQQIWKPDLHVTDRCVTCHLGMGPAAPVPASALFAAHPPIPHDPADYGCTPCHGGQGRATTEADAHGFVSHWDEQILDQRHLAAGCGTCHDRFPTAPRGALARGQRLVESLDCLSCHPMDGRGRGTAPVLTYVGLSGFREDWHADHLARRAAGESPEWRASYGEIAPADVAAIDTFLRTRVGAPRIVEAQALAFERGCLGCHRLGGRGGDEGPALDQVGRKPVGDLDFTRVTGEATFTNYVQQHLADPARVVAGSLMPAQSLTADEVELLTSWILYLRSRTLPAEYLPKERLRRTLLDAEPTRLDGDEAFGMFCAGCHGPEGRGRNYANLDVRFPAIGAADFLDVAGASFIERTLAAGRPGRRMPALAGPGGSLGPEETAALVAYLESLAPAPPSLEAVGRATAEPAAGAAEYQASCATCHGRAGEGTAIGSPLATADARRERRAVHEALTAGVADSAMPAYSIYDAATLGGVLAHVERLPVVPGRREGWRLGTGDAAAGGDVYAKACAGCHGATGQGAMGPALANPGFQGAATLEFLVATIVRGRAGTPMPAFGRDRVDFPRLAPQEVLDVAAFVKQWGSGK